MDTQRTVLLLFAVILLAGVAVYFVSSSPARAQTAEMVESYAWEYAELYVMESPSQKKTQILFLPPDKKPRNSAIFERGTLDHNQTYFAALDVVGNLGWEMIQVRSDASRSEPYNTIYYFKRRK
ncbi:MAG: hypothetical protein JXA11_16405 [Phycisphaerae bacterium]|nr:hypothetical protein [Phycisphaerae bacterium]